MPEKASLLQIAKLKNGLKLAEQWVNSMTKCPEDEEEVESDGRPPRLGLGAKAPLQVKAMRSNDLIERKLLAKLNSVKRETAKSIEESIDGKDEDESDDDFESKTNAFSKRKPVHSPSSIRAKKKQK